MFLESRQNYKKRMDQMNAGMKRNQELQTENEATAAKLFAMQHSKQDVRGDIQGILKINFIISLTTIRQPGG